MRAMILAAGKGTRLKPLTDTLPKPLIKIAGKPMLQHTIEYLKKFGITEIIINVHYLAEQIVEFLEKNNNFGLTIHISYEKEKLLDVGGGIKKAAQFLNTGNDFIVMTSDVFTNLNLHKLIEQHKQTPDVLVTLAVKNRNTTRNLLFDEQYNLCGWKNNLTGDQIIVHERNKYIQLGFSGIHVISSRTFDLFPDDDVFSIIKFYLAKAGEQKIKGYRHDSDIWVEFGRLENLDNPDFHSKVAELI